MAALVSQFASPYNKLGQESINLIEHFKAFIVGLDKIVFLEIGRSNFVNILVWLLLIDLNDSIEKMQG